MYDNLSCKVSENLSLKLGILEYSFFILEIYTILSYLISVLFFLKKLQ